MLKREGKPMYPRREDESIPEGQCVSEDDNASFIEFQTEDDRAHGFPYLLSATVPS